MSESNWSPNHRKVMEKDSLPPAEEVQETFKAFRQVLKAGALLTPLQRVNRIAARNTSIALWQKRESEASRIYNLLPPGHYTRLKVEFLHLLSISETSVSLKIPVTLLKTPARCVLLKTSDSGQVVGKCFNDEDRGLQAFLEEVQKVPKPKATYPRFVHKRTSLAASFYSDAEAIITAWKGAAGHSQVLQQFVQPHSKKALLLRVHWKVNLKSPTFYYISQQPRKTHTLPNLIEKVCDCSRSLSENDIQCPNDPESSLIVQRSKEIPELKKALDSCLKIITTSLAAGEKVSEMVCDFTADQQHQWVFLSCRGFTFSCNKKLLTQTVEQHRTIDLKYLMYPLIARRSVIQKRLRWNAKLRDIAESQKLTVAALMKTLHDYTELPVDPPTPEQQTPEPPPPVARPPPAKPAVATLLLNRDVSCYESLVSKSKLHRAAIKSRTNYEEKHGGSDAWKPVLFGLIEQVQALEEVPQVFTEKMGFEESHSFVNALLRVIRGDCGIYYKEALRKVHHRKSIPKELFQTFLGELHPTVISVTRNPEDASIILQRFGELEPYICK